MLELIDYNVVKALHIIFVVTWFAGLFYIVRLFVYHVEAYEKPEAEQNVLINQFRIMERRLWNAITWPSAILTTLFGTLLLTLRPYMLTQGYMHIKLGFVLFLWIYQIYCHVLVNRFQRGKVSLSSIRLRFLNEVPTVILIAVVFLIIQRNSIDWVKGVVGILGVAILLTLAIKWYQRIRSKS